MPINKETCHRLILTLLLAVMSATILAADTEKQASTRKQAATQSEEPAQSPPGTDDIAPDNQPGGKTPPGSDAAVEPLREFKPTDKIQADSAVSFPIDI